MEFHPLAFGIATLPTGRECFHLPQAVYMKFLLIQHLRKPDLILQSLVKGDSKNKPTDST